MDLTPGDITTKTDDGPFGARALKRARPALGDAVAATGGIAIGVGVLLISVDIYAEHPGRGAEIAMFAGLVLIGFVAVALLPKVLHPAGITLIAIGIPGALGWWWLPKAHEMADIRPFLILTIAAYVGCFFAPIARGRGIFIALALILCWYWALGEVGNTNAYSLKPVPSPPPHTMFSLANFSEQATITLDDLDQDDPNYGLAVSCDRGDYVACDELYEETEIGTDFHEFGASCGNNDQLSGFGFCESSSSSFSGSDDFGNDDSFSGGDDFNSNPTPFNPGLVGVSDDDKTLELSLVSTLFGLAYLGMLFALDRRRMRGLGTALVFPAGLALFTGAQLAGVEANKVWVYGLALALAGLLFGIVGDLGERRFTAWFGGLAIAVGGLTMALDFADLDGTFDNSGNLKIAGPGFIVMAVGVVLIAFAFLLATQLGRYRDDGTPPVPATPTDPDPAGAPTEVPVGPATAATMQYVPSAPPPPPGPPVAAPPLAPVPEPAPEAPPRTPWDPPAPAPEREAPPRTPWDPPASPT